MYIAQTFLFLKQPDFELQSPQNISVYQKNVFLISTFAELFESDCVQHKNFLVRNITKKEIPRILYNLTLYDKGACKRN